MTRSTTAMSAWVSRCCCSRDSFGFLRGLPTLALQPLGQSLVHRGAPARRQHPGGEVRLLLRLGAVPARLRRRHLRGGDLLPLRDAERAVQTALLERDRLLSLAATDRDLCHLRLLVEMLVRPGDAVRA